MNKRRILISYNMYVNESLIKTQALSVNLRASIRNSCGFNNKTPGLPTRFNKVILFLRIPRKNRSRRY